MLLNKPTTRHTNRRHWYAGILALAVLLAGTPAAPGQDPPPPDDPNLLELFLPPGTIDGTGTHLEITDSEYLNITLDSSEPVQVRLKSVPQMVVMHIEAAEGATSTALTLGGFAPSTTYYKYEDDYHNGAAFTTDANGSYAYAQGLSGPHLVFIQPQAGTKFIPSDTTIGTWDPVTRTYTLTTDVYETIQIDEDNLTLDGAGHTVTGPGYGFGVFLSGRTGVTIRNLNVQQLHVGFQLWNSSYITLTGNTASNNNFGIWVAANSHHNTLTGNTASYNRYGIALEHAHDSTLIANAASNNRFGIFLSYGSTNNTLTDNTASDNEYGIDLTYSPNTTLTGNTMQGNRYNFGVWQLYVHNIDTSNTVDGKPIYYVVGASNATYGSTANAGAFHAVSCDNITVEDLTLTNNEMSLPLCNTTNSTVSGVAASDNLIGIQVLFSQGNTLTNNTTNSNDHCGIYMWSSGSNTLIDNTASNNEIGILIGYNWNTVLTGNTMSGNRYNFNLSGRYDHNIDTINTVDGKPIYYMVNASGETYDSSTNAGTFYAVTNRSGNG